MICPNCGGDFADWAPKCPYCGNMNYQGAEKQYMERLETLRQDMGELPEQSKAHYRKGIGDSLKKLLRPLAVLVLAVAALVALGMAWERHQEKKSEERSIRLHAWERENFPRLDQWYEAGEYDKILDFDSRLWEEDSEFSLYTWEHYTFVGEYYEPYRACLILHGALEAGEIPSEDMVLDALPAGLFLVLHVSEGKLKQELADKERWGDVGLTVEEASLVREYRGQAETVLYEDMGFTAEEARELYGECVDEDGYMRYAPCFDYADTVMERMGWDG